MEALRGWGEKSLITLKDVDCVRDINNRDSAKRPDRGLNQTMLRVEFEVQMFLISARSRTLPLRCHL